MIKDFCAPTEILPFRMWRGDCPARGIGDFVWSAEDKGWGYIELLFWDWDASVAGSLGPGWEWFWNFGEGF